MRGTDEASGSLFSFVDLEERIPTRHPLRKIRQVVNDALASLDAEFQVLYTDFGRPPIAPERLIYYRQGITEQCHERGDPGPPRGRTAVVGRSLLGRRDAGEGVGLDEEFSVEGRRCATRRRSGQPAEAQHHHRG
jgi:hypothetical protein